MRISDETTSKLKIVDCISTYIENLRVLKKEWCDENTFMVYRGEPEEYDTPCIPTIFREFALKQNKNYEKNMFMAMRQSNISKSADYLHNAIDAQHDGFPSRLLDVSYNSLIALYFAVTPYYYKEENISDNKDGIVYVFKFDEVYSPEASNTQEIYENALKGTELVSNSQFLSLHHMLIDHCKQNKRIIAQQGAFILFSGDSAIPIPQYQICGIRISKEGKARIRNELRYMFGIYTGSVYPEVELMHEEVKARCIRINTCDYDVELAVDAAFKEIEQEYDYYADCCDYYASKGVPTGELIRIIEKSIVSHKKYLNLYLQRITDIYKEKYSGSDLENKVKEKTIDIADRFDNILVSFISELPDEIVKTIDVTNEIKNEGEDNG